MLAVFFFYKKKEGAQDCLYKKRFSTFFCKAWSAFFIKKKDSNHGCAPRNNLARGLHFFLKKKRQQACFI